jgi:hypothetical protein
MTWRTTRCASWRWRASERLGEAGERSCKLGLELLGFDQRACWADGSPWDVLRVACVVPRPGSTRDAHSAHAKGPACAQSHHRPKRQQAPQVPTPRMCTCSLPLPALSHGPTHSTRGTLPALHVLAPHHRPDLPSELAHFDGSMQAASPAAKLLTDMSRCVVVCGAVLGMGAYASTWRQPGRVNTHARLLAPHVSHRHAPPPPPPPHTRTSGMPRWRAASCSSAWRACVTRRALRWPTRSATAPTRASA